MFKNGGIGKMQMKLGMGYFSNAEQFFNSSEIEEMLEDDSEFFIEYAERKWLSKYFKMKAMASKTSIPSLTSTISNTPPSKTNEFRSTTETHALKAIVASEWVEYFHEKLDCLPEDYKKLIQLKYLTRKEDGRCPSDYHVYSELSVSRTKYYQMKKEALEELGRLLYPS